MSDKVQQAVSEWLASLRRAYLQSRIQDLLKWESDSSTFDKIQSEFRSIMDNYLGNESDKPKSPINVK